MFAVALLQNVGISTQLALVGSDQLRTAYWSRRGLEVKQLELAITTQKKIDFAVVFRVTNANPNGEPLNGNRPRTDSPALR